MAKKSKKKFCKNAIQCLNPLTEMSGPTDLSSDLGAKGGFCSFCIEKNFKAVVEEKIQKDVSSFLKKKTSVDIDSELNNLDLSKFNLNNDDSLNEESSDSDAVSNIKKIKLTDEQQAILEKSEKFNLNDENFLFSKRGGSIHIEDVNNLIVEEDQVDITEDDLLYSKEADLTVSKDYSSREEDYDDSDNYSFLSDLKIDKKNKKISKKETNEVNLPLNEVDLEDLENADIVIPKTKIKNKNVDSEWDSIDIEDDSDLSEDTDQDHEIEDENDEFLQEKTDNEEENLEDDDSDFIEDDQSTEQNDEKEKQYLLALKQKQEERARIRQLNREKLKEKTKNIDLKVNSFSDLIVEGINRQQAIIPASTPLVLSKIEHLIEVKKEGFDAVSSSIFYSFILFGNTTVSIIKALFLYPLFLILNFFIRIPFLIKDYTPLMKERSLKFFRYTLKNWSYLFKYLFSKKVIFPLIATFLIYLGILFRSDLLLLHNKIIFYIAFFIIMVWFSFRIIKTINDGFVLKEHIDILPVVFQNRFKEIVLSDDISDQEQVELLSIEIFKILTFKVFDFNYQNDKKYYKYNLLDSEQQKIALSFIIKEDMVSLNQMIDLIAEYNNTPFQKWLVISSSLSEKAYLLAKEHDIKIIEQKDLTNLILEKIN